MEQKQAGIKFITEKKASTPHPRTLSLSKMFPTHAAKRHRIYWVVKEVFPSFVYFWKRLLSHIPCVPKRKSLSSEGVEDFANLA